MISFFTCLGFLVLSYFTYAKYVEHTFGPTNAQTPAIHFANGVDYVPMPLWRMFLVQLLNIAGLGPVFGAISGALWGPSVFLWITFLQVSYTTLLAAFYPCVTKANPLPKLQGFTWGRRLKKSCTFLVSSFW